MSEGLKIASRRVVGARQVLRALETNKLETVFLAQDASPAIRKSVTDAASAANTPVVPIPTMEALGRACRVDVASAAAGLYRQT